MGENKRNKWYKATEKMLYTYKSFPIRIKSLRQQLNMIREQMEPSMIGSYGRNEGISYTVSSPVETAVINRIEGDIILKLERKIKNLETLEEIVEVSIKTMLDSDQEQLVDLIYNRNMTWQQICIKLSIDKNTFYAKKKEIVKVLAWCFGYLPDEEAEEVLGLFMDQALWQKSREKTGKN